MRVLRWVLMGTLLVACGGEPTAADEPPAATSQGSEPEPEAEPEAEPGPETEPEPLGRCHVSCCSARILEMQAQSDDPSTQNECCFCED